MKMHNSAEKVTYKAKNIHANDGLRDIFFFSDPPHLVKTVRNCWASNCRFMWVNNMQIMVGIKSQYYITLLVQRQGNTVAAPH